MFQTLQSLKSACQRRCIYWGFALGVAGNLLAGLSVADTPPRITDAQIELWMRDLSSSDEVVRKRAESQLLNAGTAALPLLRRQSIDGESENGLLIRVRRELQTKLAEESVIGISRPGSVPGDRQMKHSRFPDSKEMGVKEIGVVARCVRIRPTIAVVPSEVRTEPVLLRARVAVDVAEDVRPLRMMVRDSQFQLDASGTRFAPFSPDARREIACDEQSIRFTVNFLTDEDALPDHCTLTGSVQLLCLGGVEQVEFPVVGGGSPVRSVGETEATLTHVECDLKSGLTVSLMIEYPPGLKWESYQVEALHQHVWFRSGDADPIKCQDVELIEVRNERHTVQCRFPQIHTLRVGDRLINSLPALIADIEIPFEIKNIPVAR